MDNYKLSISLDKQIYHFEVGEYLHHNGGCKVKVYQDGKFMVSFEPDQYDYLQVCQNENTRKEVPYDKIVKGYKWKDDNYVIVEESDYEAASAALYVRKPVIRQRPVKLLESIF